MDPARTTTIVSVAPIPHGMGWHVITGYLGGPESVVLPGQYPAAYRPPCVGDVVEVRPPDFLSLKLRPRGA